MWIPPVAAPALPGVSAGTEEASDHDMPPLAETDDSDDEGPSWLKSPPVPVPDVETQAKPIRRKVRFEIPPSKDEGESPADKSISVVRKGNKGKKDKTWHDAYGDATEMQSLAAEAKVLEAKHELNVIKGGTPGPNSLEHLLTHLPKHPDCQICKIAKMKNKHCRRKVKIDPLEKVPGHTTLVSK